MEKRNRLLLEKADRILKSNIYEPDKYLWGKYRLISPDRGHFRGVWNWDSAFHAIGMKEIDEKIAEEQILGYMQFQTDSGLLPDFVGENGSIQKNFSKPPVFAWASEIVYRKSGNKSFLKEVYPYLVKNEAFWVNDRCVNGLFHYDANKENASDEKQYLKWVGFETGWDDSPRWDETPQYLYAVDLNCFMLMMYQSLEFISKEIDEDYEQWRIKKEKLSALINEKLWNDEINAYTDYNFLKNTHSIVLSPASFMPLFVGISDKDRAEAMNKIAKEHFLPGMPSVSYDNLAHSRQYWRGPCWLNVAYFAAKGLKNYGFSETADEIKETILNWVYNDGEFIHENYDSKTGEGLCAVNFSWSCVFVKEFILNF